MLISVEISLGKAILKERTERAWSRLAVACAVRTDGIPDAPPLPALQPRNGELLAALRALHPLGTEHLVAQPIAVQLVRT